MTGIVYPSNWKNIINQNKVIENSLQTVTLESLKNILIKHIAYAIKNIFKKNKFCLALSGGIDSSILAVLLFSITNNFTAITIGSSEKHPDIIYATELAKKFNLEHKIKFLTPPKISKDTYNDLFKIINKLNFKYAICGDTIDEMLGGYREHAHCCNDLSLDKNKIFEEFWKKLILKHLKPMNKYAKKYGVNIVLPYLAIHDFCRKIDLHQRIKNGQGKIILRHLAEELNLPKSIIYRRKYGLCSVWDKF